MQKNENNFLVMSMKTQINCASWYTCTRACNEMKLSKLICTLKNLHESVLLLYSYADIDIKEAIHCL